MQSYVGPPAGLHVAQLIGGLGWGGTQELLVVFSEHCARHNIGISVIVLRPPEATPYHHRLLQRGARVLYIPARKALSPRRCLHLVRILRRTGVQLIHAHLSVGNTIAPIAGLIAGIPVIGGLHTLADNVTHRAAMRCRLEALSLRAAACGAVACSPTVAERSRQRLGRLPIEIIPNPAPHPAPPDSARSRRAITEGCRFIAVGRLAPQKGFDVLLQAAALAKAHNPHFTVTVVGDGPSKRDLEWMMLRLGLEDTVHFLGARSDVSDLLAASDVFVSSSRWEGLSVALLEAMAHGLAVVATTVGDTPLALGDSGWRVPPEDPAALASAMVEMASNSNLRQVLGESASARVLCEFKPEAWSERLADFYWRVAAGSRQIARA